MKKLTDAIVAKALGWKTVGKRILGSVKEPIEHHGWWKPNGDFFSYDTPPPFTSSLDAIVAEIEARGLDWEVLKISKGKYTAFIQRQDKHPGLSQTAPLALCAALLAYLKEQN